MTSSSRATLALLPLALLAFACSDGKRGPAPAAPASSGAPASTAPGATAAPTASAAPQGPPPRTKTAQVVARYGEGFLELDHGGQRVLHVKGDSYERGFQYGYLVGDQLASMVAAMDAFVRAQGNSLAVTVQPLVAPAVAGMYRPFFDADALEELRGIVAGNRARDPATRIGMDELVLINSLIDFGATMDMNVFKCSSIAAWGPLTRDGKTFQTRVVDLMVGTGLEDHTLVVIAKPDGGVPYLNAGWVGLIGSASGLNAHGVGVGQVWAFSRDKGLGRPWVLATRELLASGANVDDAIRILQGDVRTYGCNFVFADRGDGRGGVPRGVAIESTKHHLAVFESDDPKEDRALWSGQPYGIRIPHAVFRGDAALDPRIRALQTASNGPDGDPRAASAYQNRYAGQANALLAYVNQGTLIGEQEMMQLAKDVAMPRNALQCVVYANSDLEVWVANARLDGAQIHVASDEPYHRYSLDYYTPTARLTLPRSSGAAGAALEVGVALETLGRERRLEVTLRLEAGGASYPLGSAATLALDLAERGAASGVATIVLPAGLPAGPARLVADVCERGTDDLVDVATIELTVTS